MKLHIIYKDGKEINFDVDDKSVTAMIWAAFALLLPLLDAEVIVRLPYREMEEKKK